MRSLANSQKPDSCLSFEAHERQTQKKTLRPGPPIIHPLVKRARAMYDAGGWPIEAYDAFKAQFYSSLHRGIAFLFNPADWWHWWQTDDRWSKRGLKGNGLVMARVGDKGPYAGWNVYCCTTAKNIQDADHIAAGAALRAAWDRKRQAGEKCWLDGRRGDDHPSSRAVMTPDGRFGSARLAAEHFRIDPSAAQRKARKRLHGWSYATQ